MLTFLCSAQNGESIGWIVCIDIKFDYKTSYCSWVLILYVLCLFSSLISTAVTLNIMTRMLHQKIEIDLSKVRPFDEEMKTDHEQESIPVGCMCTARLQTVRALVGTTRCHSQGWVGG